VLVFVTDGLAFMMADPWALAMWPGE